jgi:hypothetical protein
MGFTFTNKEAAEKELEKYKTIYDYSISNLVPGLAVKFSGSRSNSNPRFLHREILEIKISKTWKKRVSYLNPEYVEFDDKGFKWASPEYKRLSDEYMALPPINKALYLYLEGENIIEIVSKNVYSTDSYEVVVATNSIETLSEIKIDNKWVKFKNILKEYKLSRA